MGIVIAFPAEKCTAASGLIEPHGASGSVIILPVIRIERQGDAPEPTSSSPRGKRRKR